MAVTMLKLREAPTRSREASPGGGASSPDDFLRQATMARDIFASRPDFHAWFACVLHRRAYGEPKRSRAECDATSSLACAMSFHGECAFATAGRQLDTVMRALPTSHLEQLLRICRDR